MKSMNKQQGFTLVELIIVIVILGILAVTAAPKFFNFTEDARVSVLEGAAGSIKAANTMVHGKATLAGLAGAALACFDTTNKTVTAPATGTAPNLTCASGEDEIVYGYLGAVKAVFEGAVELSDFTVVDSTLGTAANGYAVPVAADTLRIAASEAEAKAAANEECYITYTPAASKGAVPTVDVDTDGCN